MVKINPQKQKRIGLQSWIILDQGSRFRMLEKEGKEKYEKIADGGIHPNMCLDRRKRLPMVAQTAIVCV